MELRQANKLAIELMEQHGLLDKGWHFAFDRANRRFGSCQYHRKRITLSKPLTELNSEQEIRNTILHEIAHALCPREGHNQIWKMKAIEIGCDGERCYSSNEVETMKGNYVATCCNCDKTFNRFRKPKYDQSCGKCSGGRYNPTYKLNWIKN